MMQTESEDNGAWYRQRWPWYIIGLLLFGVIGSGALVVESIRHQDPLVVDNYYKKGLAINRVLDQQRVARIMGLRAQASYDAANGLLTIKLEAGQEINARHLELRFIHATLANRDYNVKLSRQAPQVYQAQVSKLLPGNYDLILEPQDASWRLDAHVGMPVQSWKLEPEL